MLAVTLNDLRAATLQAANMEGTTFIATTPVGTSELDRYINQSWYELYEMMATVGGADYFMSSQPIVITSGNDTYPLPNDFYCLRGVDIVIDGDTRDALPYNFNERNIYKDRYGWTPYQRVMYRLQGQNVVFIPVPSGTFSGKFWYFPTPTTFTSGAQAQDFVAGWDEYVIVDAAIKCLRKEESDVALLLAQKEALKQRIMSAIPKRDAAHPGRVTIVRPARGSRFGGWWE